MKVTGKNSAALISSLYEYTLTDNTTDTDSDSLENLLTSNLSANNSAMTALASRSKSASGYQKTLTAADQTNELLQRLTDAKRSVFVKEKDTTDEEEKAVYQLEAMSEIINTLSSYNTLVTNLADTGGKTNKNFLSELDELVKDHKQELEAVGITQQEDGTLVLNADKLAAADMETLAELFGPESSFAQGLTAQVGAISERTATTVDTLQIYSTAYSNSGSYSQYDYMKGLYDLKA